MCIVEVLKDMQSMGKVRFIGFTGLGESNLIHKAIDSNVFDTVQVYYNLLQASAGYHLPEINGVENYFELLSKTIRLGIGTIAIRVLAGGILTDSPPDVDEPAWPVMSLGNDINRDIEKAKPLVDFLPGWSGTLQELAIRFVLSDPRVSTALIGFSGVEHIHEGIAALKNGPLAPGLLALLKDYWSKD
jgi:aryl-alcohol dehydrogenase-like predicted oxidoreductase